MRNNIKWWI